MLENNTKQPENIKKSDAQSDDYLASKAEEKEYPVSLAYETELGRMYQGKSENALNSSEFTEYYGKVQLIFTSPPFPLNRKKKYGNFKGDEYIKWLSDFASIFKNFLTPNGSIVMELGNAWEPGVPVMSPLALRSLLAFLDAGNFHLCQQFIAHNPARLPSPAQWVNVERVRVKDSFTHIWWMSHVERPKADNRLILKKYSKAMTRLLETKKYNSGNRPSEHHIGETSFLTDNKGAIPSNVLTVANTASSDDYLKYCRKVGFPLHPARMPKALPEFFINFLTNENDLVLDPFGGSNITGATAEKLNRRWISIEPKEEYIQGSRGRFSQLTKDDVIENDNQ